MRRISWLRAERSQFMFPLEGIRVLDLSRILSGPFCTMMLADMGAEVIKVEEPGRGDDVRYWGPPFVHGESAYFLSINRNKKSITIDLKSEAGKQILTRLIEKSDVLVENYRPGTMDRLGFGYDRARALNSRLIYCSISGYGQTGPRRSEPGYDVIIQGESGVQSVTGFPDGPPLKMGISIADIVAGMYAAQGILLALLARERTGEGQHVDVALLDAMISTLTYQAGIYFATGRSPIRMGNRHPTIVPYETFRAKDDYLIIAVGNDAQWQRFCRASGLEHLAEDERFTTNPRRVENYNALKEILDEVIAQRDAKEWIALLKEHEVPCGLVRSVGEALSHPHTIAREMIVEVNHAKAGTIRLTGIPIKLSATPGSIKAPPPLLGQHTEEIMSQILGYSGEQIGTFKSQGVV